MPYGAGGLRGWVLLGGLDLLFITLPLGLGGWGAKCFYVGRA